MSHADTDPHPAGPARFLGRTCSFDHANDPAKRLVGIVADARYVGRTTRGNIPDYLLTIRGASGALLEVSLVERRASFPV